MNRTWKYFKSILASSTSSSYCLFTFSGMPLDLSGMKLADHPEPEEKYLSKLVAALTRYLIMWNLIFEI